ncbi:MAG: APC family permease, partial [Eubacterium sp.]|nr:APC family permease [Eubacterium sp.]
MKKKNSVSYLSAWALGLGSIIGWGAFVMPGSTFLPEAGPVGTMISVAVAVVVMCIIASNFQYMMTRYPDQGGVYVYTTEVLGADHGFICAWYLGLVYIGLIPLNTTAMVAILRIFTGRSLQFFRLYSIGGYDVYLGEVLSCAVIIIIVGAICKYSIKVLTTIQAILVLILIAGTAVLFVSAIVSGNSFMEHMSPAFSENGRPWYSQILSVLLVMPWAFIGFESITYVVDRFRFPVKRSGIVMIAAIFTGGCLYVMTTVIASVSFSAGSLPLTSYINDVYGPEGIRQI